MRTSGVILSLSLALLSASAPAVARTSILGWRLWSPTANKVSESATIDSSEQRPVSYCSSRKEIM